MKDDERMTDEEYGSCQAFPVAEGFDTGGVAGMTLRDYYIGQAMQGVLASFAHPDTVPPQTRIDGAETRRRIREIADAAVKVAAEFQPGADDPAR